MRRRLEPFKDLVIFAFRVGHGANDRFDSFNFLSGGAMSLAVADLAHAGIILNRDSHSSHFLHHLNLLKKISKVSATWKFFLAAARAVFSSMASLAFSTKVSTSP